MSEDLFNHVSNDGNYSVADFVDFVDTSLMENSKIIPGEIVFEPLMGGLRVTARDQNHTVLWGFVASKSMIERHPCPVAIHTTLKKIITKELAKHNLETSKEINYVEEALRNINKLQKKLNDLKKLLKVKKVTDATNNKGYVYYKATTDAISLIEADINNYNQHNA
jgi:hypothetical protein